MPYKVFFVEDEIVTREGIRDNVDWNSCGFEFCGEAADGEMALPLLQTTRPDVLITDIKMPFMDGLQLSKIVKKRTPGVKIIILSGHDEFEYAQQAIEIGVTEYLLKPVTVNKLHQTLKKISAQLDQEKETRETLDKLHEQLEENRSMLKEQLILKLVVGAISPADAIEKGQLLGLDLVACCYLVVILKIELGNRSEPFDFDEYQRAQLIVTALGENTPDVLLLRKDWEEFVLVMKGDAPEKLELKRDAMIAQIRQEAAQTRYQFAIGAGLPKNRIADIHQSFLEALVDIQNGVMGKKDGLSLTIDRSALLQVDKTVVENYLRYGTREEFDQFFDAFIQPLGESALQSYVVRNYLFVDVVLATVKLVSELGGEIDEVIPELNSIEALLVGMKTGAQLRAQVHKILFSALAFRDGQVCSQNKIAIRQAKAYIEQHYGDAELSLTGVAAQVNLSASHFSVVFGQETGQNFKEYLIGVRIKKAKELLRTTALKIADIAYQVGYSDPHYFSAAFKRSAGFSPSDFRTQAVSK